MRGSFRGNSFLQRFVRLQAPPKDLHILNLGETEGLILRLDIDSFENGRFPVNLNQGFILAFDFLDDYFPVFEGCQIDSNLVFSQFLFRLNPVGLLVLHQTEFFLLAIRQNPVGVNRVRFRDVTALREARIILDDIFVFAAFNLEKGGSLATQSPS